MEELEKRMKRIQINYSFALTMLGMGMVAAVVAVLIGLIEFRWSVVAAEDLRFEELSVSQQGIIAAAVPMYLGGLKIGYLFFTLEDDPHTGYLANLDFSPKVKPDQLKTGDRVSFRYLPGEPEALDYKGNNRARELVVLDQ